jgi:hypothetical protein
MHGDSGNSCHPNSIAVRKRSRVAWHITALKDRAKPSGTIEYKRTGLKIIVFSAGMTSDRVLEKQMESLYFSEYLQFIKGTSDHAG